MNDKPIHHRRFPSGAPVRPEWWRKPSKADPDVEQALDEALGEEGLQAGMAQVEMFPIPETPIYHGPLKPEAVTAAVVNILQAADEAAKDNVTLPEHYARFEIEPIRFICENRLNFFQGNILKYILRWDAKNGMEDLKKAQRYLEMFIKWVDKDPDWWKAAA